MALDQKKKQAKVTTPKPVAPVETSPAATPIGDKITFKRNPDIRMLEAEEVPVELKDGHRLYVPNNDTYVTVDRNGEFHLTEAGEAYLKDRLDKPTNSLGRDLDDGRHEAEAKNNKGGANTKINFSRSEEPRKEGVQFKHGKNLTTGPDGPPRVMTPREIAL